MDDRRRMESFSLIAFKLPGKMKRHLQYVAAREDMSLSKLIRHECLNLLKERSQQPITL